MPSKEESANPSSECLYREAREGELFRKLPIDRVERLYREVWNDESADRTVRDQAGQKLALLLLQSSRSTEADSILQHLGYKFRLARNILNYSNYPLPPIDVSAKQGCISDPPPCFVFDKFLTDSELHLLKSCFMDEKGMYWKSHNYTVEPPSPYFSYLIPLSDSPSFGSVGLLVQRIFNVAKDLFPAVKRATMAEIWSHNRPHATGHQMHFDSDNEGCTDVIRNPIVSCVLCLSCNAGGPTVVTSQRLTSQSLASKAWCVPCNAEGRLILFDGKLLHGVIPGSSFQASSGRRVTLMVAFWKSIRARTTPGQAACCWPSNTSWAQQLVHPSTSSESQDSRLPVEPIEVTTVYESTADSRPWTRKHGLPDYEQVFQSV